MTPPIVRPHPVELRLKYAHLMLMSVVLEEPTFVLAHVR